MIVDFPSGGGDFRLRALVVGPSSGGLDELVASGAFGLVTLCELS